MWHGRQETPGAKLECQRIDLADLSTIRDFTERALAFPGHQLDILLNNAGMYAAKWRDHLHEGFFYDEVHIPLTSLCLLPQASWLALRCRQLMASSTS